jgi:hypothetical protein
MPRLQSVPTAVLYFAFFLLVALNPEKLPVRDWFNAVLDVVFVQTG